MQDVKPIRGKGNRNHFAANWKTTAKSANYKQRIWIWIWKLGGIVYGLKLKQEHNLVLSHQKFKKGENTCMRVSIKDSRNKNYV